MNDAAKPTTEAEATTQNVKLMIEINYPLTNGKTLTSALQVATTLLDEARKHGSVEANMVFGRQKFPL